MFQTVEIPVWVIVIVALLAAVAALERILVPSVRWFFRRRMERVVARLNTRLERPIEPFKLARRHDTIQRLIYSPQVSEAINEYAASEGVPENVAFENAQRYAKEIVPSFSATAYFGFAIRLARVISRSIYRIRIGYFDEEALSKISPEATVVFVMNHRSNMDYVLVTYLAAKRAALSYAVGEWARVWPLQGLIRSMGAYFIRRKSYNALYRGVLARYVQMATEAGVAQAVFPEGRLSLTGGVGDAKLGILSYVISGYHPLRDRDVVFVPVALNYDRVLEDRVLREAAHGGRSKFKFSVWRSFGFMFRQLRFMLTGRFHRFGYAAVSFGEPLSLRAFSQSQTGNLPPLVAEELMTRVRAVVPAVPVPMVATIFEQAERPLTHDDVVERYVKMLDLLRSNGVHVHVPRDNPAYGAEVGLRMLKLRRFVLEQEDGFVISPKSAEFVTYYAESIAHFFEPSEVSL
ncbi:1-acyl-sn-glycerol-3-phosphate acyltransferase [Halocynthiibacter sp. C4]|uniref:1-acyl-sn-glycerol-3-phosphate acyltransferase n=1 Tax=Halocynthiibacter sp. C4 TaxID=2992758 RepID=UPI00237C0EBC|nr:1-acyl-sn-glycerol-3-phosphate acyltransferase [Halocynthiibacter sp. C4]MDE0590372.1 1-acyl-sn-glycerol-3-phosphate acyltransferase [Halocynthiibacter sp. C4]